MTADMPPLDIGPVEIDENGIALRRTPVSTFVRRIKESRGFSYIKINHGLWEILLEARAADFGIKLPTIRPHDPWMVRYRSMGEAGGFGERVLQELKRAPLSDPDLYIAAGPYAFNGSEHIVGYPADLRAATAVVKQSLPADFVPEDATLWKSAMASGEFADLIEVLRDRHVVLVGPPKLDCFGTFAGLPSFEHLSIPEFDAEAMVDEIEREIVRRLEMPPREKVFLFQAGIFATWWILRLHARRGQASFIDVGLPLNVCRPETAFQENWARVFWPDVLKTLRRIQPDLVFSPPTKAQKGRDAVDRKSSTIAAAPVAPVPFVEEKTPDWDNMRRYLDLSDRAHHWANFGPVSVLLEEFIAGFVSLAPTRRVIACASGTAALNAVIGAHSYKAGRRLRWVTSAFGFWSSALGPLSDVRVVDCDATGMLDLEQLGRLPPDSYDGVVVTNIFGLYPDLSKYRSFCSAQGKVLVVDNALGFDSGYDRGDPASPDEIISLHQTKPWGVGEGGCAVVSKDLEPIVRALLNFGVGLSDAARPFAMNAKISDYACALLLDRLNDAEDRLALYRMQSNRIVQIGRMAGLEPLRPDFFFVNQTIGHVPLLSRSKSIPYEALDNKVLVLRKYYAPLAPDMPRAADLYNRIVNVPCHPAVAGVPSQTLVDLLAGFAG